MGINRQNIAVIGTGPARLGVLSALREKEDNLEITVFKIDQSIEKTIQHRYIK